MAKPAIQPYHVVPGTSAARRILLISYHSPPSSAVGALRWTAMARYFAERGWGFDVLAADPSGLQNRNETLFELLPPGTRLFGIPDTPPLLDTWVDYLVRLRQRLRSSANGGQMPAAPEPVSGAAPGPGLPRRALNAFHAWREFAVGAHWARQAAIAGRAIFDRNRHQVVISSGPPHLSHEGGRLLARWTDLPLIADFRDAWRFQEWVPLGPAWQRLAKRYERRVVEHCALVVANVEPVRELMQRAYPGVRTITITNGVDEDPLPPITISENRFVIGYPGTIYLGRDPGPLIQAVGEVTAQLGLTPEDLTLEFMGFFEDAVKQRLTQAAERHGAMPYLRIHSGRPRAEALAFMARCAVLVGLQAGSDLAVPAKVFEFMRFPSWQLVLAGKGSATARLLEGTGADVLEPEDVAGIREALLARFTEFRAHGRPAPIGDAERFTRRYQTERLLAALAEVLPATAVRS